MKTRLFIGLQYLLPQHLLSRLVGYLAETRIAFIKNFLIKTFVKQYQVNLNEAKIKRAEDFENFNDFFTRELEEDARIIDSEANSIASPCDGAISELGDIKEDQVMQAKGHYYSLNKLLANDSEWIENVTNGKFMTCYLSPKDYHRVHAPISGKLLKTTYVPGDLFSVNKTTAENVPDLFARNERLICEFETEIGSVIVILVGALIVAGIETSWSGHVAPSALGITTTDYANQNISINKGEEIGRFKLGSTAILLFPKDTFEIESTLATDSALRMGQSIGTLIN